MMNRAQDGDDEDGISPIMKLMCAEVDSIGVENEVRHVTRHLETLQECDIDFTLLFGNDGRILRFAAIEHCNECLAGIADQQKSCRYSSCLAPLRTVRNIH